MEALTHNTGLTTKGLTVQSRTRHGENFEISEKGERVKPDL